jgi:predicted outer membrane repeat protein
MLMRRRVLKGEFPGSCAQAARRRGQRRIVAGVECLEDRAVPTTFTVATTLDVVNPGDGKLSLREAISAANAHAGADTIVVPAGVYRLAIHGSDNSNAGGDLDVTGTTVIRGAGKGTTFIDGHRLDRVFDVRGTGPHSIKVTFQSLTIRNGLADAAGGGGIRVGKADLLVQDSAVTGNKTSGFGGGISNVGMPGTGDVTLIRSVVDRNIAAQGGGLSVQGNSQNLGSVLTVSSSTIRRNIAREGGGIFASRAILNSSTVSGNRASIADGGGLSVTTATLSNSVVSGNTAAVFGGGIEADTVTLTNSTVSGNNANAVSGGNSFGSGGGISAATATLTSSTVSGNIAALGGGISASVATLSNCIVRDNIATTSAGGGIIANNATITRSTISGNHADASDGGGIRAVNVTLSNTTVSGNTASNGGGILSFGMATLTNTTVSGNHAADQGGGILAFDLNLLNDTVTDNDAHTGGGVLHFLNVGTATVRNTIIAQNLVDLDGTGTDVSGIFTSGGHNLIGDGTGGTGFKNGTKGDQVGTAVDPIDPGLDSLANNGGPTMTHALLAGSSAIDRGDNAGAPATDERGVARPRDGDGNRSLIVDIGAFEK